MTIYNHFTHLYSECHYLWSRLYLAIKNTQVCFCKMKIGFDFKSNNKRLNTTPVDLLEPCNSQLQSLWFYCDL